MADYFKWPAAAAFACATALGLLALLVYGTEAFHHLDLRIFDRLSAHHRSNGGEWAEAIAMLADPEPLLAMLAAACGVALVRGRPADAVAAVLVVAGANVTTQLLKMVLAHPRAQTLLGGVRVGDVAFPSGPTTAAFSIAIAFAFVVPHSLLPLTLALGAAFGLAVGCSVVVIAWHFPSDVLGGFLVASGWGFGVLAARRALGPRQPHAAGISSPGPLPSP